MARKPNYRFERTERERAKAAKKEKKAEKRRTRGDSDEVEPSGDGQPESQEGADGDA